MSSVTQSPLRPAGPVPQGQSTPPRDPLWRPYVIPVLFIAMIFLAQTLSARPEVADATYTRFYSLVESGAVKDLTLTGRSVKGTLNSPTAFDTDGVSVTAVRFQTLLPQLEGRNLLGLLRRKKVQVKVSSEESPAFVGILEGLLPWVLMFA